MKQEGIAGAITITSFSLVHINCNSSQLYQDNKVRQSVLLTTPESVGTCRAFLLSLGMRTVIKGVLFSSSPVRGAIELGCTTRQQNTGKFRSKQGHMPR